MNCVRIPDYALSFAEQVFILNVSPSRIPKTFGKEKEIVRIWLSL